MTQIVCLCGSTKFKDEFMNKARELTLEGRIVLSVGFFSHSDGIEIDRQTKAKLDVLHLRKIDLADYIYVLNVDDYIGESTEREIEYARSHEKRVYYLEPHGPNKITIEF